MFPKIELTDNGNKLVPLGNEGGITDVPLFFAFLFRWIETPLTEISNTDKDQILLWGKGVWGEQNKSNFACKVPVRG